MKNKRLLFSILFLTFIFSHSLFAQETPKPPIPIGTRQINDSIYLDETEVANIHWLEFLHYIKKDSGEVFYRKMLPDTTVLANFESDNSYV
jgi:hypothetical protein